MTSWGTADVGGLFISAQPPGEGKRLKDFLVRKKKHLRLSERPKARIMHQRKLEAFGPRGLSEGSTYPFTLDGLGGDRNESRSPLTKGLFCV